MPADLRAFRVALHERLDKLLPPDAGKDACARSDRLEPLGYGIGFLDQPAPFVVVVEPEVARGALRNDAVHPDLMELEPLHLVEYRALLVHAEEIGAVDEPVGC